MIGYMREILIVSGHMFMGLFEIKQTNNEVQTRIISGRGTSVNINNAWNVSESVFGTYPNYTKVKLVWTIDIENYVNGTNNTAQKLYINNTEYDCLTTTESVSAYNGLISNGHYGTGNYLYANNSANVYTNIYLSSFRGNWDGHGNSQNGLPDIESLEYLRVFDRIVEPHEWDTDGMYPLDSISKYYPHDLIYENTGEMGSVSGTDYEVSYSAKAYKTLTIRSDNRSNQTWSHAKIGRFRIFGYKLRRLLINEVSTGSAKIAIGYPRKPMLLDSSLYDYTSNRVVNDLYIGTGLDISYDFTQNTLTPQIGSADFHTTGWSTAWQNNISSEGFTVQPSNINYNRIPFRAVSPGYYIDPSKSFIVDAKLHITDWASNNPFFISFHKSNTFGGAPDGWEGFGIHRTSTHAMRLTVFVASNAGRFNTGSENEHYELVGSSSALGDGYTAARNNGGTDAHILLSYDADTNIFNAYFEFKDLDGVTYYKEQGSVNIDLFNKVNSSILPYMILGTHAYEQGNNNRNNHWMNAIWKRIQVKSFSFNGWDISYDFTQNTYYPQIGSSTFDQGSWSWDWMSGISSSGFLVQPSNIDTNRVAFKATSPEYYIDSSLNFAIQTKFNITNWASSAPFFISFHASNVFFQASPWYGFGIHKYGTYMRLTVFDEETNGAFGVNNHYNLGGSISELSSFPNGGIDASMSLSYNKDTNEFWAYFDFKNSSDGLTYFKHVGSTTVNLSSLIYDTKLPYMVLGTHGYEQGNANRNNHWMNATWKSIMVKSFLVKGCSLKM